MRIEPTTAVNRADRVQLDRPATMRDPDRTPIDVLIRNLSATGALLEAESGLPVGTLVSLGIAGAGLQIARVARAGADGMAVEFMLPLDPAILARAHHAETLVSVAFPQILVERAPPRIAAPIDIDARAAELAALAGLPPAPASAATPFPAARLGVLAIVAAIVVLLYLLA